MDEDKGGKEGLAGMILTGWAYPGSSTTTRERHVKMQTTERVTESCWPALSEGDETTYPWQRIDGGSSCAVTSG